VHPQVVRRAGGGLIRYADRGVLDRGGHFNLLVASVRIGS
jgi:hypothetical protein